MPNDTLSSRYGFSSLNSTSWTSQLAKLGIWPGFFVFIPPKRLWSYLYLDLDLCTGSTLDIIYFCLSTGWVLVLISVLDCDSSVLCYYCRFWNSTVGWRRFEDSGTCVCRWGLKIQAGKVKVVGAVGEHKSPRSERMHPYKLASTLNPGTPVTLILSPSPPPLQVSSTHVLSIFRED